MLWFFLALSIAFLTGVSSLVNRFVLKDERDYLSFALGFQLFSALFFIPLFTIEWEFPTEAQAWALALLASILWAAIAVVGFKSYRYAEVSLRTPVGRSKVLWVLFFSAFLLGEAVTGAKLVGILLIFAGVVIVAFKREKPLGGFSDPGVKLTLLSAFMGGMVAIADKAAMAYFQPAFYGFLQYLLPTLWLCLVIPKPAAGLKKMLAGKGKLVVLTAFMATAWTWMLFYAYKLAEVSLIAPVLEISVLVATFGGIMLLGERKDIGRKILGAAAVIAGALVLG
jgi:transporter family protein